MGEVLDRGNAGLVVVYGPDTADRVASNMTRARSKVRATTDISIEQLAAEVHAATTGVQS